MKRFLYSVLLMLCMTSAAQAQVKEGTLSVVPHLGVNISNTSGLKYQYAYKDLTLRAEKSKAAPGITVGAEANYQLTDLLYLSAGVDYSLQRAKFDNITSFEGEDDNMEYYMGISSNKVKMGYIHVPVMVGCYVYNSLSVKLGVQFGYLTSAKWSYAMSDITLDKATGERTYAVPLRSNESMTDMTKKLEVGIPVGVSYEYEHVLLDLRYYHGLTNVLKDTSSKNHSLSLTVGYRFDLANL